MHAFGDFIYILAAGYFALLIFFPVNTLNTVVIDAVGTDTFVKISR